MRGSCESCGGITYKGNALCCRCVRRESLPAEHRTALARKSARARWEGHVPAPPTGHRAGDHTACELDQRHGVCSECGKTVVVARSSAPPERRRCRECQQANPKRGQPKPPPPPTACARCGNAFERWHPLQRFCSRDCYHAAENASTRHKAKSRARRLGHAETWDGISDEAILDRDRWRCGICGKRIGKTFKYPHSRSKSIDHIVPLSEGGTDTADNKRAAHLGCNVARGNRGGGEQLALIG